MARGGGIGGTGEKGEGRRKGRRKEAVQGEGEREREGQKNILFKISSNQSRALA